MRKFFAWKFITTTTRSIAAATVGVIGWVALAIGLFVLGSVAASRL